MTEPRIWNRAEVVDVLSKITFAPSCVDMGWQWEVEKIAGAISESQGWLISTTFRRPDTETGIVSTGEGRKWYVPLGVTESGLVKTAFAAAKLILEHELMEAFLYNGAKLFDPHHSIEDLNLAAHNRRLRERTAKPVWQTKSCTSVWHAHNFNEFPCPDCGVIP